MDNLQLVEVHSRLKSLRQNLPARPIATKFVSEFHQILDLLEQTSGTKIQNFRIPSSEVRPISTGGNYLTGEQHYSKDSYCDQNYFTMKVDGALTMFELVINSPSGGKLPIGFRPPG